MNPKNKNKPEDILSKYVPEPNTGCWLWTGYTRGHGYGGININGKVQYAHRVSYELKNDPITKNMLVLHKCDTPSCINPDHLFLGTDKDNSDDKIKKGRRPKQIGMSAANRKLSENDIISIRHMYFIEKKSYKFICNKFSINSSYFYGVLSGKYWSHIAGASKERQGRHP